MHTCTHKYGCTPILYNCQSAPTLELKEECACAIGAKHAHVTQAQVPLPARHVARNAAGNVACLTLLASVVFSIALRASLCLPVVPKVSTEALGVYTPRSLCATTP